MFIHTVYFWLKSGTPEEARTQLVRERGREARVVQRAGVPADDAPQGLRVVVPGKHFDRPGQLHEAGRQADPLARPLSLPD